MSLLVDDDGAGWLVPAPVDFELDVDWCFLLALFGHCHDAHQFDDEDLESERDVVRVGAAAQDPFGDDLGIDVLVDGFGWSARPIVAVHLHCHVTGFSCFVCANEKRRGTLQSASLDAARFERRAVFLEKFVA